jgi:DNA-directed RNA polymerase subunit F
LADEEYLSLAEVKELLEKEKDNREELMPEQKLALSHAEAFAKLTKAKTKKLVSELVKMDQMSEPNAYKIADVMPEEPDEVRAIFSKERFTLTKEETDQVLKLVRKYL